MSQCTAQGELCSAPVMQGHARALGKHRDDRPVFYIPAAQPHHTSLHMHPHGAVPTPPYPRVALSFLDPESSTRPSMRSTFIGSFSDVLVTALTGHSDTRDQILGKELPLKFYLNKNGY